MRRPREWHVETALPGEAKGRLSRRRLTQAGSVVGELGLSGEQRAQLAFLLCNENTDDLSAQFRHAHPARIGDAFEPHHRRSGDMKLHSELTAGTVLGRQPCPARLSDLVTT